MHTSLRKKKKKLKSTAYTNQGTGIHKIHNIIYLYKKNKGTRATGQLFFLCLLRGTLLLSFNVERFTVKGPQFESSHSFSCFSCPCQGVSEEKGGSTHERRGGKPDLLHRNDEGEIKGLRKGSSGTEKKKISPKTSHESHRPQSSQTRMRADSAAAGTPWSGRRHRKGGRRHNPLKSPQLLVPLQVDARWTGQRGGQQGGPPPCVNPSPLFEVLTGQQSLLVLLAVSNHLTVRHRGAARQQQ